MRQYLGKSLFFLLIFFISLIIASSSSLATIHHRCLNDQRSALVKLRNAFLKHHSSPSATFDVVSSMRLLRWDPERDCCSWDGVTCDDTGNVVGLNISHSMISGHIDSVFSLRHLQRLNLAGNHFGLTPIPSGFERLENLTHLDLSNCCFSDQIPAEFSRLRKLVYLRITTMLLCELPPTGDGMVDSTFEYEELHRLRLEEPNLENFVKNLSSLKELYLESVDLSSQGSNWSEALAYSLPNIQVLSLSYSRLSGPIQALGRLKSLSGLVLNGIDLSSEPLHFLQNLSNLQELGLAFCNLNGDFPKNIFMLPKLKKVDLSKNSNLSGELPEFPSGSSLQQLSLYQTNFQGKLPESMGNLKSLTSLLISYANFSGTIPSSLANISQIVEMDFSSNSFSGPIPPFDRDGAPFLQDLRFSYNLMTGTISPSLFTLPSLNTLYLDDNRFSGELSEFPDPSSSVLEYIYLQENQLTGPIPKSIFELPRLLYLSLASNKLNGTVRLEMFKNVVNLTRLYLSDNELEIEPDAETFSLPLLEELGLSRCNVKEIPSFLKNEVHMRSLNLSRNQIQGFVPSWILSSNISELDLSMNPIGFLETPLPVGRNNSVLGKLVMRSCNVAGFPDFLQNQVGVWYLDLSDNKISGRAPSWIWKENLVYLNISHNLLYAVEEFPPNVSLSSLATLDLRSNLLQGSLPRGICNLSSLSILDASNNNLSGSIPECLGTLGYLSVLNMRKNKYRQIPSEIGFASSLRSLNVNSNQLEGKLPRSLGNCTMLEVLDLGNNSLSDTFPFWVANLTELKVLVLRSNRFYGPIEPHGAGFVFPKLSIIDLSSNAFSGELSAGFFSNLKAMMAVNENKSAPRYIGEYEYYHDSVTIMSKGYEMFLVRILNIFVSLDLSNNSFCGEIPAEIGRLRSLVVLNLSRNGIDGQIPLSMEGLTEIESLDLSRNGLTGSVPPQLTSLTFLSKLDLSYNKLTGHLPQGNQFYTFSSDSYEGNPGLCGLPLKRCQGSGGDDDLKKQPPVIEKNSDDEEEEGGKFDWKFASMGYGSGLGIGFSIGYMLLSRREYSFFVNLGKRRRTRKQGRRSRYNRRLRS